MSLATASEMMIVGMVVLVKNNSRNESRTSDAYISKSKISHLLF